MKRRFPNNGSVRLRWLRALDRTPRGRVATRRAYEHLDIPFSELAQPNLL